MIETKPPKPWTKKMRCTIKDGGCGGGFVVEAEDVFHTADAYCVQCPYCGRNIDIEGVRFDVAKAARDRQNLTTARTL